MGAAGIICCLNALPAMAERSVPADTMRQVVVVAPLSRDVQLADLCPVANSTFRMRDMEKLRVTDVKELSAVVPNLHIPDYGSRMTSSVYIRGLGSRIDQPAMGVYVDGVPLLNKNTYDFPLLDVRSIAVLRGPQNTLYGRNAMGGVMDIKTISPLDYEGTRLMVEGGNGNTWRGRASTYRRINANLGMSVAAQGSRSDGYYVNEYKNALIEVNDDMFDFTMTEEEKEYYIRMAQREGREEGRLEGIKEGEKAGRKEGKKEGKLIGAMQSKIEIAKQMLKENFDIESIIRITKLDRRKVEDLIIKS